MFKNEKLYAVFAFIGVLIGGLISFLLFKGDTKVIIKNLKNGFKLIKNPDGTNKLPETPELDDTLQKIEDDIIGKKNPTK